MSVITLDDLIRARDDLKRARFAGVRELRDQNGESITYRSDREMAAALASIEAEIAAALKGRSNTIRFQTSKGV